MGRLSLGDLLSCPWGRGRSWVVAWTGPHGALSVQHGPQSKAAALFRTAVRVGLPWLRGQDLNLRPSGYEPDELPGCSTPRQGVRTGWDPAPGAWGREERGGSWSGLAVTYSPASMTTQYHQRLCA